MADVKASKIDVIVVYKIDRLSRSMLDFLNLVELFERHGVTFVSVSLDISLKIAGLTSLCGEIRGPTAFEEAAE